MSFSQFHDAGQYCLYELAQVPLAGTAGSTPDNTQQNGLTIDRLVSGRSRYSSAQLILGYKAVINTAETMTLACNGQMSTDNFSSSNVNMVATRAYQVATDGTRTALTLTTGALASQTIATAGTATGVVVVEFDLASVYRYLRSQVTFNLSRANTDTFVISGVWCFSGPDILPAA